MRDDQKPEPAEVSNTLARLPLSFEPNYGQSGCEVMFQSRAPGYLLQLTATEMRMIVRGSRPDPRGLNARDEDAACASEREVAHALRFTWLGANPRAGTAPESALPGTVNYLKGSDSSKWRTSIPTFERVRYRDMYPGVDLLYYGNGRQLEYDLIVAPGADPEVIRLSIEGAEAVLAKSGDLDLFLSDGRALQLRAPVIYQERGGEKRPVEGRYRLAHRDGASEIAFDIAAYDPALPLVIDPLLYSTFLGGSGQDDGYAIAVNAAGEAFATGFTADAATDYPTTAGAFDTVHNGNFDVFVTRLNADGTALLYSTFLGGSGLDVGWGIAVNAADEVFVTGQTLDDVTDFPTTAGAFATIHNGNGENDGFVSRLNAGGTALLYSTFLGGSSYDIGTGIAVNAANEAFVTGITYDDVTDFPTTAGAFDTSHNGAGDAFVARLNADGSALLYSTFLGGSGEDFGQGIAVNAAGEAFVTGPTLDAVTDFPTTAGAFDTVHNGGNDAFVTRLNAGGAALLYSTFLGGSGEDLGYGLAVNAANEAFVTGYTFDATTDFPTTAGAFATVHTGSDDAFVTCLNAGGSALLYSTFLGGSSGDYGLGIAVNAAGEAFVTGETYDDVTDFPTTAGAFDTIHNNNLNGGLDAFVTRLNAGGTALRYSTFLGGSSSDSGTGIAVNVANEVFVTGRTSDGLTDFPTTAGAFDTIHNGSADAFVTRLATWVAPTITNGPPPDGTVGVAYNFAYTSTGSPTFSVTAGGLPTGLTLSSAGVISGTPTTAGTFTGTVTANNGDAATQDFSITIAPPPPPTITNGPPQEGTVGIAYNFTYASTGSPTFSVSAGGLPPGLSLSPAGVISGTPTTAGTFTGTVTANNGTAPHATQDFSIVISVCLIIPTALAADGNGVMEAGETAGLTPSWHNDSNVPLDIVGTLSSFTGPGSSIYSIVDGEGSYGPLDAQETAAASDNYSLSVTVPATRPSVHWDASVVETAKTTPSCANTAKTWSLHIGNSFTDVATSYAFYRQIETLLHNSVTLGCGDGTQYCKDNPTPRISMAVFIARAELGSDAAVPVSGTVGVAPYSCTVGGNSLYTDVALTNQFCKHVHYIASQNITQGCTATTFCPSQNVTRLQMAIFLARALAGSDAAVPTAISNPANGRSYDLPNNSRAFTDLVNNTFEKHANYLWARGISDGCTLTTFCPSNLLTRGQMAKFLVGTYDLLLYKP